MRNLIEDGRIHVFDGAMGTQLYTRGVFVNVCYDEVNLSRPDLVRADPPGLRGRRRGDRRDQHVRRQSRQAVVVRARGPHRGSERDGRAAGARRGRRPGEGRGRDRPARHPHRAVGPDVRGRGGRALRATGAGAPGGRRRGLRPGDVLGPGGDRVRATGRARRVRPTGVRPDDGRSGRQDRERHRPDPHRADAHGLGLRRDRAQLLGRPGRDARCDRGDGRRDDPAAVGAAERGAAAHRPRPADLHGQPRVHGRVRAPHGGRRRPLRRRLLRHDARPHPGDPEGRARGRGAPGAAACDRATAAGRGRPVGAGRRWPSGRGSAASSPAERR